jgi:HK97 family phage portal protein
VEVTRDDNRKLVYVIRKKQAVTARDLIHIRGLTLPGYDKGLSPIECARHSIGLALSAEKHGSKLFAQGTAFDTVIKAKGKLTRDQAKDLATGFALAHSGGERAFMPAIIDGDADIEHFSMTQEEAQFLATRQFQVEEVARWYGVPPHRIALTEKTTSWGSGIEEQNLSYLQDAVTPILVSLEAAFNPLVRYENPDYYVRFNVSSLLRGNMAARKDYYQALWNVGALSPDDIRALEDSNPLPGGIGGNYYVPMNYAPIGAPVAAGGVTP